MSLASVQNHLMGYLLDTANGEPSAHLPKLEAMVGDNSPAEGLQIYSHAYSARLIEVLGNDHEKLTRFLGEQDFRELAAGFVAAYPSQVRSLRYFGERFPEFLSQSDHPHAARAAELCRFERTLLDVYDAPFGEQPQPEALQALAPDDWPQLVLAAHPSLRLFQDSTQAIPLWQQCNEAPGSSEPLQAETADPPEAAIWVLWRDRPRVCQFRHLERGEQAAMQGLLIDGESLAVVAEALLALLPAEQLAPSIQQWLNQWLADGLIARIATSP